jgi:phosphohistidine phosphatase
VKRLGLLRHAKADFDDVSVRDFERGLNDRGRRGAKLISRRIAELGIAWDHVIASPAVRVKATLAAAGLDDCATYDERAYLADAATLVDLLRQVKGEPANVLIAGHNPGLHELIFRLIDPDQEDQLVAEATDKFPTAAFALLEFPLSSWASLQTGNARLVLLTRPRDLDPALGPERFA